MIRESKKPKFPSELRFDLVSRDWVVIATGRAKRPEMFKKEKRVKIDIPKRECPFCRLETQGKPLLIYPNTVVIPNKYPAFLPYPRLAKKCEGGLYQTMPAVGFCELVISRDHQHHFPRLETSRIKEIFDAYQERYLDLMKKSFVSYISIFHNQGAEAGASQPHPHSQIVTTPLIDTDLEKALLNSKNYFKRCGKCIYCQMNEWEEKVKKRVVFENDEFLAICPFASKSAFEIIISPKKHLSNFEEIGEKEKWKLAEAFKKAMSALDKGLGDPAYNFYLHTAPCDGKRYPFYHWHWTILPKTAILAGFEIGTRMEISTITPEKAAEYLRKQVDESKDSSPVSF